MFRKTNVLLLIILLLSVVVLSGCFRSKDDAGGSAGLTIYGFDNSDVIEPIISKYREKYTSVNVKYKKFNNLDEFEDLIVNEIAEGEGPDVFYIKNTWLPRHLKKIVPLTSESLTPEKFREIFVNVAAEDFVQPDPKTGEKRIYALPLYVDTLALYYNKKDFETRLPERGKPANNWNLFLEDASKFREQQGGKLSHGLVALGRSDNIKLAVDVLYNFFLQGAVVFYDDNWKQTKFAADGQRFFDFFLSFADSNSKNFSWSTDLASFQSSEIEAFLTGKISSILAYSDLYPRLNTEIKNVKAKYDTAISEKDVALMPMPQFSENENAYKVFANYYGLAVSRNAKNPKAAWNFVEFAASQESARAYHSFTKRPAARRDLIEEQKKEPVTDVFVSQVGYAGSFRLFSDRKFAEFLKNALISSNGGLPSKEALSDAQESINKFLKTEAPDGIYKKLTK